MRALPLPTKYERKTGVSDRGRRRYDFAGNKMPTKKELRIVFDAAQKFLVAHGVAPKSEYLFFGRLSK